MTLHPIMSYELAVKHDQEMLEAATVRRELLELDPADLEKVRHRPLLAGLGRLLIAVGEKLSGVNLPKPPDLASNPR
jgi:hypothetical protein